MAQGTSLGRPQSSPLMKLASRPRNRPIGAAQAIASPTSRIATPAAAGEQDAGRHHAEQAAVERHAALPDLEGLERVAEVEVRPVEQDVAEPAAQHDAERDVEQQVVESRAASAASPAAAPASADTASRAPGRRCRRARTSGSRTARSGSGPDRSPGMAGREGARAPRSRLSDRACAHRPPYRPGPPESRKDRHERVPQQCALKQMKRDRAGADIVAENNAP